MAKRMVTKPAFEPIFTQEDALKNLSPEFCRNRDVKRRLIAVAASKTERQVIAMAKKNPDAAAHLACIANEMEEQVTAEAEICKTVFARLCWALDKTGHVELPA